MEKKLRNNLKGSIENISLGDCLVIGAGDLTISCLESEEEDLVIAVDGGLSYCGILELEPDIIIGDFDSISQGEKEAVEELKKHIPDQIIELSPEKDDTDMLAALRLGLEKGYRSFRIYAGTGGRLEHTLANIQCLLYLKNHGATGYIMDGNGMIFVMQNEEIRFKKDMSGFLSLFSLSKEAKGVTIEGLKYPLTEYTLTNDFPIGISNEFVGEEGLVRVRDGELAGIICYIDQQTAELEGGLGKMEQAEQRKWWQSSVIYQIYPRSFMDSNGDGIGDLQGIISKLDYLKELGIDAIWLSPVCRSPQDDNGYDISDYQDIDPMFGSLQDMEELIKAAGDRNIGIIMDLVLNHSSDEHFWFREARKSKDNPYHDYYVWRDGIKGIPPNDMKAGFGGSAWEWVPELKQYYFHQFSVKQPDLNWDNPKLRREIYDMILWWMDKGVKGFRLDVIDQIAKEPDRKITANGPKLHDYIRELSRETFQKGDIITVGEAWGANIVNAKRYSNPDGSEFSMVFQFEHINLDQQLGMTKWDLDQLDLYDLKRVISKWQRNLFEQGWNSLFWNNHDLPRIVSRWGNDSEEFREVSAKMLATLLHGLQGTPYIYQGEELGMTNVKFPIEDYRDIETLNMYQERMKENYPEKDIMESIYARSRDNARTPMQWDDSANAGFTTGTPWIRVNPDYDVINAKSQLEEEDSIFHYYRKLIELRKSYPVFIEGSYTLLYPYDPLVFAYTRQTEEEVIMVLCNFSNERVPMALPPKWKTAEILIHNYEEPFAAALKPYEALIFHRKLK